MLGVIVKPFLRDIVKHIKSEGNNRAFILNMHALPTVVDLVEVLLEQGIKTSQICFIGKPYSTVPEARQRLSDAGIQFLSVPSLFKSGSLIESHNFLLAAALPAVLDSYSGQQIVLLDSGGLLSAACKAYKPDADITSIQLTSSGSRKFGPEEIVDIGHDALKKDMESPYIAQSTLEEINSTVNLSGRKLCVVGAGAIGLALAKILNDEGFKFHHISGLGNDQDGVEADLVIGATGYDISPAVQKIVPRTSKADLFSASSWDIEYQFLLQTADMQVDLGAKDGGIVQLDNWKIHNGGCPINFNRKYADQFGEIAMTRGLTLAAALAPGRFSENRRQVQQLFTQHYG